MHYVLNVLLIFHTVKWTAPICCLPLLCWVGNVILQGHMWEQFKILTKRESVKSELCGSTQYRHEMFAPVPKNKSRRLCEP